MKILFISHEYPPVGAGGATALRNIMNNLRLQSGKAVVLTGSFDNLPYEEKTKEAVIFRVKSLRKNLHTGSIIEYLLFIFNGISFFIRKGKNEKFDIICSFFTLPGGAIALYAKKIYKIPYIVFLRGIDVPGFYGGRCSFLNKLLKPFVRYIWSNADAIISNSFALRELALKTFDKKPITVIPNGVDSDIFFPEDKPKDKQNKLKIIFAGRLNKQKGLDYLFKAIFRLKKKLRRDFILEIIGDGPETKFLVKKSQRLKIDNIISFSGWLKREDLALRYREADIFVTASLGEGMPNTVLEAMASGLPIIASDIPPHRELIENGKNGILVKPKDSSLLSDAIEFLALNDSSRCAQGKENSIKAKNYSWNNIASQIEDIAEKIINSKNESK